jgi:excinuclease ABC subunit C
MLSIKKQLDKIKKSPGVYIFRNAKNKVLYIGKAKNLRSRVRSYFIGKDDNRPLIPRIVADTAKIETVKTNSEVEAILLEAELIRRIKPLYNARQKDDKSFIYIFINFSDPVPRVQFIRQKEVLEGRIKQRKRDKLFGPFLSAFAMKKLLNYFRLIIPFRDCGDAKFKRYQKLGRGCQWLELGKCSAPCTPLEIEEYRRNISQLSRLLTGKINRVKKELLREMKTASKKKQFELAAEIRDRIKTLEHIKEVSLLEDDWAENLNQYLVAEGVDISNISGKYATGSIIKAKIFGLDNAISKKGVKVQFDKNGYRRFRIRNYSGADDTGMIKEVVNRRFTHKEWVRPDFLLIDGGKGQINAAESEIKKLKISFPIVSIAKGPTRKGESLFFNPSFNINLKNALINNKRVIKLLRDEAHRFAVSYHKILRRKGTIGQ